MTPFAGHPQAMLTEIYIEALLVDNVNPAILVEKSFRLQRLESQA